MLYERQSVLSKVYLMFMLIYVYLILSVVMVGYFDGYVLLVLSSIMLYFTIRRKSQIYPKNKEKSKELILLGKTFIVMEIILFSLITVFVGLDTLKYSNLVAKFQANTENIHIYTECRTTKDIMVCYNDNVITGTVNGSDEIESYKINKDVIGE